MSTYDITIREVFKPGGVFISDIYTAYEWSTVLDGEVIGEGSERAKNVAHQRAEAAATLHARKNAAKIECYEFTP